MACGGYLSHDSEVVLSALEENEYIRERGRTSLSIIVAGDWKRRTGPGSDGTQRRAARASRLGSCWEAYKAAAVPSYS